MNPHALFYEPSGRIHPIGLAAAYLAGLLVTSLLGYLYTLIVLFVPLIYLNFLVTVGFGIALGILVRLLTKLTQNRSLQHQLLLAILLGLFANYCQWVGFVLYAILGIIPGISDYYLNLGMITDPSTFFGVIGEINRVGMWEVFGITANGGILTMIWLLEFAIIAAFPVIGAYKAKSIPYAEDLQTWYPKYELDTDFEAIIGPDRFVERLRENALTALQELDPGLAWKYSKAHIHYLPEATHQYLSMEKVYIEDRGQGNTEVEVVINNFRLDRQMAKAILDAYPHRKERWEW